MRHAVLLLILALSACGSRGGSEKGATAAKAELVIVSGAVPNATGELLVDFGNATLHQERTKRVVVRNVGGEDARIEPPAVAAPFGARLDAPLVLAPGEEGAIVFSARLTREGFAQVRTSLDWKEGALQLRLHGEGVACSFRVGPREVDFGMRKVGVRATSEVGIQNVGAGACTLEEVRVEGAAFSVENRSGVTVLPGASTAVDVHFTPHHDGRIERGTLRLVIAGTMHEVALSGSGVDSCLAATPNALDLGRFEICGRELDGVVELHNDCDHPLVFTGAYIEAEEPRWGIDSMPKHGMVLQPGASTPFRVRFSPLAIGKEEARLVATFEDWTLEVPMVADVFVDQPRAMDEHQLGTPQPVDLLLVFDDTTRLDQYCTFDPEGFGKQLAGLLEGADFHLGITTLTPVAAAGCGPAPDGRLLPLDGSAPRILDRDTPDLAEAIASTLAGIERCQDPADAAALDAALRAADELATLADDPKYPEPDDGNLGFRREGSHLQILFALAGDDANPEPISILVDRIATTFGKDGVGVQSWVPFALTDVTGAYELLPYRFPGGFHRDLCLEFPTAFGLPIQTIPSRYFLRFGPTLIPETVEVRIDGALVPREDEAGESNWSLGPDARTVEFASGRRPPPESLLTITYTQACDIMR